MSGEGSRRRQPVSWRMPIGLCDGLQALSAKTGIPQAAFLHEGLEYVLERYSPALAVESRAEAVAIVTRLWEEGR